MTEEPSRARNSGPAITVRESEFYSDPRLLPADQAQLEDFRRSGFDRAPSGDMPGWQAQQQSFSLANKVPQTPELNRGIWAGIETAVRDLAAREGELYVAASSTRCRPPLEVGHDRGGGAVPSSPQP